MLKCFNNVIPFKGFLAVTIYPFIFIRKEYSKHWNKISENHESIHAKQQLEMLIIFFYIWYIMEWFIKLFKYGDGEDAYYHISFEREAYEHENNLDYLNHRKLFSWIKYL